VAVTNGDLGGAQQHIVFDLGRRRAPAALEGHPVAAVLDPEVRIADRVGTDAGLIDGGRLAAGEGETKQHQEGQAFHSLLLTSSSRPRQQNTPGNPLVHGPFLRRQRWRTSLANLASLAHRLDPAKRTCRAVIECPRGGRAKYS